MKKICSLVFLCFYTFVYSQETKFLGRIVTRAKIPKILINDEIIKQDFLARFQRELTSFFKYYKPIYEHLITLDAALLSYSKQTIEYQENYQSIALINSLIDQIKQKPLTIAMTKLLQYKTPYINSITKQAELYIHNLKKIIQNIETTFTQLSTNPKLLKPFVNNPPEKIVDTYIADYFKNYASMQFFFKIKKIKRSIINWENKQI